MNLQQIRKALSTELQTLDARRAKVQEAIKALGGGVRLGRPPGKRKMSAAGRAAISRAQKARWAKLKATSK